jgi:hypothetical protein
MRKTFQQFIRMVPVVGCFLLAGCGNSKDEIDFFFKQGRYESWLCNQRPYLSNFPPSIIYYHGVSREYSFAQPPERRSPQPVVEYFIKAGNWDGIICLRFRISVDAQKRPAKIEEESAVFYKLPFSETVVDAGYKMHRYYGLSLTPAQAEEMVRRAARGDHFDDLRNQVRADTFFQYEVGHDDWEKLKTK